MQCIRKIFKKRSLLFEIVAPAQLTLLLMCWASFSVGQTSRSQTFPSAEKASTALFEAVQSEDDHAIARILGGDKDLASSGDDLADHQDREVFLEKYRQMHRLVQEPDGTTELYIGAENWPFPVPLVSKNGGWFFDSDAGSQEVRFRRVGENEEYLLENCAALSASTQPSSDVFHGYYFRRVGENESAAAGKVVLIAYPAEYRSSGVMTFVVTSKHEVFEKDLGPKTASIAKMTSALKVDRSWRRTQ
jgi:hypothetical protein